MGIAAVTVTDIVGWEWNSVVTVHVHLVPGTAATSVSIRRGAIGRNGPVEYSLMQDVHDSDHWHVKDVELGPISVWISGFQGFYLNVETAGNPDGEARAQLETRNKLFGNPRTNLLCGRSCHGMDLSFHNCHNL